MDEGADVDEGAQRLTAAWHAARDRGLDPNRHVANHYGVVHGAGVTRAVTAVPTW